MRLRSRNHALRVKALPDVFLDAADFEDTLRNAVSLGGDADTLACIAGGIAHAYYGAVPDDLATAALGSLPAPLREVWEESGRRYGSLYAVRCDCTLCAVGMCAVTVRCAL